MKKFGGFPSGRVRMTPVPAQFISELLPEIDHLGEMKVVLYALWFVDRLDTPLRYLTYADFAEDDLLVSGLPGSLDDALERAVRRGALLRAETEDDILFFLNSPRGRAAIQALQANQWQPAAAERPGLTLDAERPNVYGLYEENIGPITPMIADELRDAEGNYPAQWIEEAMRIAVRNNARRWNYIARILQSWQEEGKDGTDR